MSCRRWATPILTDFPTHLESSRRFLGRTNSIRSHIATRHDQRSKLLTHDSAGLQWRLLCGSSKAHATLLGDLGISHPPSSRRRPPSLEELSSVHLWRTPSNARTGVQFQDQGIGALRVQCAIHSNRKARPLWSGKPSQASTAMIGQVRAKEEGKEV